MGKSQHLETLRMCPACGLEKLFPARNEACSKECALRLQRGKAQPGEEAHDFAGDTWSISLPKTPIHTLEQLLAHCKVDTDVWIVERFVVNKWEMGAMPRDGSKPVVVPLFQVKATLRRNLARQAAVNEIAALKEDAKQNPLRIADCQVRPVEKSGKSGIMLEVNIPDLHMGKLAWAKETGYTNYDSRIAAALFQDAVQAIIRRSLAFSNKIEQICFVVGNDLLNADNAQNTTTHGTPQHCDVRYQKTFRATRIMVAEAAEELRKIAPVRIVVVPGNHDTQSAWCLGDSLECWFHNTPDVVVENHPTKRKYFQWGRVMLMWTHGDKGKHDRYPLLMATEQRQMFGDTTWHEVHLGHLHQVQLRELNGVRVRILPALCAADAWHSEMGYVGNVRSAEGYIWSKDEGHLATVNYVAPDDGERSGV